MSSSRLKNLVIAALIMLNLLFLAVIAINAAAQINSKRKALEDVCAVLAGGGIGITPDVISGNADLTTMRTVRSEATEAAIAFAVLGETVMTDQGVSQYESPGRGIATFYNAGDFEILLSGWTVPGGEGPLSVAAALLKDMGLETSQLAATSVSGGEIITAANAYKGARVFNCVIWFTFNGGELTSVAGRYITGVEPAEDSAAMYGVSTALLGFLEAVRNENREDVHCSRILRVEAGYQHRVVGSFGESIIAPAWLISTNAGDYVIDDKTGEIRTVNPT